MPEALLGAAPSIGETLRDAARLIDATVGKGRGQREARSLWAAVAGGGLTPGNVWLAREASAPDDVRARFREAVRRRVSGVPFAYAAGRVAFRTLDLEIDSRALIPRPETEGLVELVLRWNAGRAPGGVAADLGTGCGCIALSLAAEGRFERVVAVERSTDAAALARLNVAHRGTPMPVQVCEGDWLEPLARESGEAGYRVIVANPPYLTLDEYAALDPLVRDFEPPLALASGTGGLDATARILAGAAPLLAPGGVLALEIDERRADAVRGLAAALGWERTLISDDLFGKPRYALVVPREGEDL